MRSPAISNRAVGLPGALPAKTGTSAAPQPALEQNGSLPPRATVKSSKPSTSLPTITRRTVEALPRTKKTVDAEPRVSSPALPSPAVTPAAKSVDRVAVERTVDRYQQVPVPAVKQQAEDFVPDANDENEDAPTPKVRVKKRKKTYTPTKGFRPTKRHRETLRLLYCYTLLTTTHLAFYFGASPDTIRKSMAILFKQGLVEHDDRASKRVWMITDAGIDFLREKGKAPRKFPSHMKFHHTLCIATVGLILEKGGRASSDLTENVLSEAPKVFITEREMLVMEARRERGFIRSNWDRLTADLLHDEEYPAHPLRLQTKDVFAYLESKGLSEKEQTERYQLMVANETAQKKVLNERWRGNNTHTGYCHLATSNNPSITQGGGSAHGSHRPDGLIAMPHIIDADGTVRGGSIAIEVELNNKASKNEYMNTILHQWHHPAYDGVFWFFDDPEAKRMFKEAMKLLSEGFRPPFTLEQARAYFKPLSLRYLNDDNHGEFG